MKRVACYVRVSTQEQKNHGLSVDSQITALQEYCANNGYIVAGVYNDAGISARKSYQKRPALLQLVADCKAGKIDLICFTKLDRWFRSVGDYYEVQKELETTGVPWRAIWEDYETETSSGVFKVNIMLSVAQSEADRTSERIKSVLEYKRNRGDYVGRVPFGYILKNGKLYKNPEQTELVDFIFSTYIETHSSRLTFRRAIKIGYTHTFRAMQQMLVNPIYSGGGQYNCEPYLTPEQTTALALVRVQIERMPQCRKYDYIFSGLCRCSICGSRMRGQSTFANGTRYYNYSCGDQIKREHAYVFRFSEKLLEKYLLAELDNLIIEHNAQVTAGASATEADAARAKIKSLEAQKERVGVRFEMGEIDINEYKNKITQIKKEISSVVIPQDCAPVDLPSDWRAVYAELDRAHKASFWRGIIAYIVLYPHGHKPIITPPEVHFK